VGSSQDHDLPWPERLGTDAGRPLSPRHRRVGRPADQQDPGLLRALDRVDSLALRTRLFRRATGRLPATFARRHLDGPRRRARGDRAAKPGRGRSLPRQNALHRRARRLQRGLPIPPRGRRRGGRSDRDPAAEPPDLRDRARLRLRSRARRRRDPGCRAVGLRAVDRRDRLRSRTTRHPRAASRPQALAGPTRPRLLPEAGLGHRHIGVGQHRRRRRQQQRVDQPPPARGRHPRAAQRGGARRRGGRPDRGPHRLPGGAQAAGRQPRARRLHQPGERGGGARRLRARRRRES
ncbi:MAG: Cyanophycin synthase(EC, partial [uncultured Thermomicrobiales bacterium]